MKSLYTSNIFSLITSELKTLGNYSRAVWMLFISRLLIVGSFSLSMMFFSIYLHTELNVSLPKVGTIMMVAAFIGAGVMLIGGSLSDKIGRRPLLLTAAVLRAFVFMGIAAVIYYRPNIPALVILYILARICGSLYLPAADAMLADIVGTNDRTKAYGIMRIFANTGFAAGPAIGGIIAEVSYAYIFALSSIVSIITSVFIWVYVRESLKEKKKTNLFRISVSNALSDTRLILFCVVSFLFFLAMGQFGVTLSIYSTEGIGITKAKLGWLFTTNGLMVIFLQYPISMIIERIRSLRKIIIGMVIYTIGFVMFGFADSFTMLVWAVIVFTIGEMMYEPSANTIVANIAPAGAKGEYMGTFGLTRSFGWCLAPFIGGLLLHRFLHAGEILWGTIGSFGVLAIFGFLILDRTSLKNLE